MPEEPGYHISFSTDTNALVQSLTLYTQHIPLSSAWPRGPGNLNTGHLMLYDSANYPGFSIHVSIYRLPTYSKFPKNSKLVLRSELWKVEISFASVKSLIKPICNTADQLHSSGQKGSISNLPLHLAHTPFQLLQAWWHLLPPVWEQFYFYPWLNSGFRIFYDHPHPVNNQPRFSIGRGTLAGRTSLPVLVPYPQTVSLEDQLSRGKQEVSLELKPKDKKRTSATQASPNTFH